MVICLEQNADLHMAQLMPMPLTVSCFSKIQIGFWYWLTRVVPDKGPLNGCVCVYFAKNVAYIIFPFNSWLSLSDCVVFYGDIIFILSTGLLKDSLFQFSTLGSAIPSCKPLNSSINSTTKTAK